MITIVNRRTQRRRRRRRAWLENSPSGVTVRRAHQRHRPESGTRSRFDSYDDSALGNGDSHRQRRRQLHVRPGHALLRHRHVLVHRRPTATAAPSTALGHDHGHPEPDPPAAANDAYVTRAETPTSSSRRPGVLANDGDRGRRRARRRARRPVVGPANGVLNLAADGSFTYTPTLGFAGSDSFTYRGHERRHLPRHDCAWPRSRSSATFSTSLLYLRTTGPSSAALEHDHDAPAEDAASGPCPTTTATSLPGLTIESSNSDDTGDRPPLPDLALPVRRPARAQRPGHAPSHEQRQWQCHRLCVSLRLHGRRGDVRRSAYGSVSDNPWNGLLQWGEHDISLGAVNRTLAPGRELRVRIYAGSGDQRVALGRRPPDQPHPTPRRNPPRMRRAA